MAHTDKVGGAAWAHKGAPRLLTYIRSGHIGPVLPRTWSRLGDAMAFIRLLLVDDDEVTLLILGALLQEQGFEVTTASTVSAALKLISSGVFDVLLSDL